MTFDADGKITNSLGDYPEAVRQAGRGRESRSDRSERDEQVFYEALGPKDAVKAFADGDTTHHNNYGSYELARCIVQGIRDGKLGSGEVSGGRCAARSIRRIPTRWRIRHPGRAAARRAKAVRELTSPPKNDTLACNARVYPAGRIHPEEVHRGARRSRRAGEKGPVYPGGHPLRQPVARHGLGEVRYRPGAGHHRRQESGDGEPVALRGRRERPRVPDAAGGVPQDGGRRGPQLVHAFAAGEGTAALHARRDHRRALCARLHEIGERDTQVQLLAAATHALPSIDKAHKWFVTRGDLDYTALWILYAATPLARIEVIGARLLADREVIPQAMKLNPAFFQTIYTDLLNAKKTRRTCRRRWTRSTATWRSGRPRCSRRCSITCAKWAKRARPPRSRPTSNATSTWKG